MTDSKIGTVLSLTEVATAQKVAQFVDVVGDEQEYYAEKKGVKRRTVNSGLIDGFIKSGLGQIPDFVYCESYESKQLNPLFVDDEIVFTVRVVQEEEEDKYEIDIFGSSRGRPVIKGKAIAHIE